MTTEDDNFDIDIYGDGEGMDDDTKAYIKEENDKMVKKEQEEASKSAVHPHPKQKSETPSTPATSAASVKQEDLKREESEDVKPKNLIQQGTKRKGESDERRIDAGATNALMLSDLHWWTTEDDIRGWANEAGAEDELRDVTFSEHKVNGKSKGQAFVEFSSPQASTALKRNLEALANGPNNARKFSVIFTNAATNPFKTLPKDAPARAKDDRSQRAASTGTPHTGPSQNDSFRGNGSFRGRGGYGGRASYQNQNNFNSNRNFSGPMNGGNAGFNNQGFQPNMPMMNNFGGGFNGRGGQMNNGMRGGGLGIMRGGRGGNQMNNPVAIMPIGMNMAMMGINPMVAGMGPQGFTNVQFNPVMFGQGGNQGMNMNGGDWGHGPKRQRQD